LSNLNRIRAGIEYLGLPKVEMAARQTYTLNPFAEVDLFRDGLKDDLSMKYRVRKLAKKKKIGFIRETRLRANRIQPLF
jgi:tRNA A37 threonylcarbamoyladenosine dehydratase